MDPTELEPLALFLVKGGDAYRRKLKEVVDHYGKSLNRLFDTLADWNTYLEKHCPDVYSTARIMNPEP